MQAKKVKQMMTWMSPYYHISVWNFFQLYFASTHCNQISCKSCKIVYFLSPLIRFNASVGPSERRAWSFGIWHLLAVNWSWSELSQVSTGMFQQAAWPGWAVGPTSTTSCWGFCGFGSSSVKVPLTFPPSHPPAMCVSQNCKHKWPVGKSHY